MSHMEPSIGPFASDYTLIRLPLHRPKGLVHLNFDASPETLRRTLSKSAEWPIHIAYSPLEVQYCRMATLDGLPEQTEKPIQVFLVL